MDKQTIIDERIPVIASYSGGKYYKPDEDVRGTCSEGLCE